MAFSLLPTWRALSVADVNAEFLARENIRLVMLDFDNTLVPYTTDIPSESVAAWLLTMKQTDIRLCVVSNSHNNRVPEFCKYYGIDCITGARKPFSSGIHRCLKRYGFLPQQALLIGDQIYTDTLGGNCAGVRTLLVKAIDNHTIWLKLRHVAEMPFICIAKNRRIK